MNEFLPYIPQYLEEILLSLNYFIPELVLTLIFVAVIVADLFTRRKVSSPAFWITLCGLVVTAYCSYQQLGLLDNTVVLFHEMILLDKMGVAFKLIFAVVSILFLLFVKNHKPLMSHKKGVGDLYMILVAVQLGLHLMAMSSNLLMIFVAIEMVSLGSYLMVGYMSADQKQTEAAMKYVLFGAVCSAVMLYGMSLIYAFTGTLSLTAPDFINNLMKVPSLGVGIGLILILVGIGFKLSFVPFHFWSPDIYEGAPTPITAFLSTGPKIAGFAILIHFLSSFQDTTHSGYQHYILNFNNLVLGISIVTMVVGNFSAIWQDNVKRMMAYSAIGHTGFLLMAILSFSSSSISAILFYLLTYAIMNMSAFMLVDKIEEETGALNITEYKGLGKHLKIELFCFVVVLLSLTGLPPTAGFIAKFLVFSAAVEYYTMDNSVWVLLLLATGAITTVVSLFYYFKVPLNAYLRQSSVIRDGYSPGLMSYLVLFLTIILLIFGIFPAIVTDFLKEFFTA